jgi:drug/metabolite transporter (DMT)-like permease
MSQSALLRVAPTLFVLLWSTGWIVPRFAMPYAEPLTFLTLRYVIAALVLAVICMAMSVEWPKDRRLIGHAIFSGVPLSAVYLAGVWWSVMNGLPVAISGLVSALQPILTALLAPYLADERITRQQWTGIALGFVGIALVLSPALAAVPADKLGGILVPLAVNVGGMVGVTLGSFYSKRYVTGGDIRAVTTLQNVGAAAATLPFAMTMETMQITWSLPLVLTMVWVVFGMSIGAVGLYLMLIRNGAVSRAATLIYLMPPLVAVQAMAILGETLSPLQWVGIVVTALGVALAVRKTPAATT